MSITETISIRHILQCPSSITKTKVIWFGFILKNWEAQTGHAGKKEHWLIILYNNPANEHCMCNLMYIYKHFHSGETVLSYLSWDMWLLCQPLLAHTAGRRRWWGRILSYIVMDKIAPPEGTRMNCESKSKRQSMSPHKATAQHTLPLSIVNSNSCVPIYLVPKLPQGVSVKICSLWFWWTDPLTT